jgi:hypothetical protein
MASAHTSGVIGGALLELLAAFASVGIAISLYPVLKKWSPTLALGAVVFRTIEAVMYVMAVVGLLSLLTLGQQLPRAEEADRVLLRALGASLVGAREHATLAGVFAFCLGALMYSKALLRARLVPPWLSAWGLAAIVPMLAACLLSLSSQRPVTGYTLLVLPIATQEMVLAGWLIFRGFDAGSALPGRRWSLLQARTHRSDGASPVRVTRTETATSL